MPKLAEIIEMFEQLGLPETYVRQALARGDSAFNAFEGLKMSLQVAWEDLPEEQRELLQPIYDRLMRITMKSRTLPPKNEPGVKTHEDQATLDQVDEFRPWALVLKDMLEYQGSLTLGDQLRHFCIQRGVEYPPPHIEEALLVCTARRVMMGAPAPKGFA
jgi:hypothetical protein